MSRTPYTIRRSGRTRAAHLAVVSRCIGAFAIVLGIAVLAGWWLGMPGLRQYNPRLGTMGSQTALSFALLGAALVLNHSRRDSPASWWSARLLAAIVVSISVFTIAHSWGVATGVQGLVSQALSSAFPGAMPGATAAVFLAFGAAVLMLEARVGRVWLAEPLAFAGGLVALLAVIAYLFGNVSFLSPVNRRALAFHSVALMVAVSFAILAARPRRGLMSLATSESVAGEMVRRMLPWSIITPVLFGWAVAEGQRAGFYPAQLSLAYYATLTVAIFGTRIWATAWSLHEVDERRQEAEEDVRRLNADLERRVDERTVQLAEANRELEAFSYSVSHDLRAPLRHIGGFAELMLAKDAERLGAEGLRRLSVISGAAEKMGRMIDDLLRLARIERRHLILEETDLNAVVSDLIQDLREEAGTRAIEWRIGTLPIVRCDPGLTKIALANLLSNAVKYTRGRSPAVIEVCCESEGGAPLIVVSDNGAGFDAQYLVETVRRVPAAARRRRVRGHRNRSRDGAAHRQEARRTGLGRGGNGQRREVLFHPATPRRVSP